MLRGVDKQLSTPEPRQHYEVHCGRCHWWGRIDQMKTIYYPNPVLGEDVIPVPACPMCLSDLYLEYEEKEDGNMEVEEKLTSSQ